MLEKQEKDQKGNALIRWHIYSGKKESEEGC